MRAGTSRTKRNAAIGTVTAMKCGSVSIEVLDATNSLKVARDVVSFAERMHRRMGIPVSVERYTIGGVTALHVSSGAVVSLPAGCVMCTELADF